MKKKVVSLLFSNYKNDNRVFKMATSLAEDDYDVTILALCYGDVLPEEIQGKVKVKRLKLSSSVLPNGNKFYGSIKYLEFFFRIIKGFRKADIWHCNDFKPFLVGVIARFFNPKLKLVYDCHELESERNQITKIERRLVKFIEKRYIQKHFVIHVSEGIRRFYEMNYKTLHSKTQIIMNVPHVSKGLKRNDIFRNKFGIPKTEKIFIYQGAFTAGRGVKMLIELFRELTEVHLVFMGYGPLLSEVEKAQDNFENIHYQEAVPYEQVLEYTSSADFGLISVENICLSYYYCMPNKLFEYTQAEVPILVNALKDCTEFVEHHGIGMAVKEETIESWKETVITMSKTNSSDYLENIKDAKLKFNWEIEEKKLVAFYNKI